MKVGGGRERGKEKKKGKEIEGIIMINRQRIFMRAHELHGSIYVAMLGAETGGAAAAAAALRYLHGLVRVVVHRSNVVPYPNPLQEGCRCRRQSCTPVAVLARTRRRWPTRCTIDDDYARPCHDRVGS